MMKMIITMIMSTRLKIRLLTLSRVVSWVMNFNPTTSMSRKSTVWRMSFASGAMRKNCWFLKTFFQSDVAKFTCLNF